jgi:hypothetical protein
MSASEMREISAEADAAVAAAALSEHG